MADIFRFKRHDYIGAADAEEDTEFLSECFIDTGDLETLMDCKKPQRIVLGRTGTGKTALLYKLIERKDVIGIKPETLSFNYLANSTILQFFIEAGVKLDLFFRLLWRHVLTVELLKRRYKIDSDSAKTSFLSRFRNLLTRNKKKERAINYLLQWGETFWEETEYRIKEITNKIEKDLKSSVAGGFDSLKLEVSGAKKLTEQERTKVVERGQKVINSIQMRELSDILSFLDEDVFDDEQQNFYITIDRLDENWVDDNFRYLLIRSLIETLRDFRSVRNVKVIVALRRDLLERVFRYTRDAGFQEEKYRNLYLPIKWDKKQLEALLDKRVNFLVKRSYTKKSVGYKDLLPSKIGETRTIEYMIARTLRRPREIIEFFNNCISLAERKPSISVTSLRTAEGEYSKDRLRSLEDEWYADYPSLLQFTFILRKKPARFRICDLKIEEIEEFCLEYTITNFGQKCLLAQEAKKVAEGIISAEDFLLVLFHVFYRTGVVGLKSATYEKMLWCYEGPETIAAKTINLDAQVAIHPVFWRVLGVKPDS